MASKVFGAKHFKSMQPNNCSITLDHDGECKVAYLKYMVCLSDNNHKNSQCRLQNILSQNVHF